MPESNNTPLTDSSASDVPEPPTRTFHLTGTFPNDLTLAALGGMAGAIVSYSFLLVDLGVVGASFVYVGKMLLYWGLLQVGWFYRLRWVRRGATLLLLTKLIELLPLVTGAFSSAFVAWLTGILGAIGIVLTFVDLWAMRYVINPVLVMAVVTGFVAEKFITAMEILTYPQLQLVRAINVGLLAWFFYELLASRRTVTNSTN